MSDPPPEKKARENINRQLLAAGWVVQDLAERNLSAARGVAVREVRSKDGPDYIPFVDSTALGVIKARKGGANLSGVAEQSERYSDARKCIPQRWADPLLLTYDIYGIKTGISGQGTTTHAASRAFLGDECCHPFASELSNFDTDNFCRIHLCIHELDDSPQRRDEIFSIGASGSTMPVVNKGTFPNSATPFSRNSSPANSAFRMQIN